MLASGVAHVQSALGLPLTLGIVCDNSLRITWRPFHITGRYCEVKSIAMGWKDLIQNSAALRHSIIKSYSEHGRSGIFSKDVSLSNGINNHSLTPSLEELTTWYSF
jgi:hypothetical protein